MIEIVEIRGKITHTLYRDETTRYTVARFRLYDLNEKLITITGYFPTFPKDTLIAFTGQYVEHPRFGMQFAVATFHRVLPTDTESIIAYLSSPLFPGIGQKFASDIVEHFGPDCLSILKADPSLLKEVKGFKPKKLQAIEEGLIQTGDDEEAMRFFTTHGLGIRNIMRLDRVYGKNAYALVKENPYRMVDEVDGIGFKISDKLALSMGFELDDPRRLKAALVSLTMDECMRTGDSFVDEILLMQRFATEFPELGFEVSSTLESCLIERKLIQEGNRVFHPSQYTSERFISLTLNQFPYAPLDPILSSDLEFQLLVLQDELGITYDEDQRTAIRAFFDSPFTIMTGGPGTGKTTVVGAMIKLWKRLYPSSSLVCGAPTGRAAKRLFEINQVQSYTIHSMLKWDLESNTFGMNENNPLAHDCLIIDEFSMVDTWLFANLLKACGQVKKILIVGDADQLPSVSPGNLLADLIDSTRFPVIALNRIYRQQEGSDVITLAHQIRQEDLDFTQLKKDVKWYQCAPVDVRQVVLEMIDAALNSGYSIQDIQVLAPMYSGLAGIDALNHAIQKRVNPDDESKRELKVGYVTYREHDKILQLKNQPNDDVFNGDIGVCIEIIPARLDENKQNRIIVDFDGRICEYTAETFQNITLAYCVSVHKAQGSEYPIVILPSVREHRYMLQKRLLYTAVTRAAKALVLVGDKNLFIEGCQKLERRRATCLLDYLSE